ncbi:hypothetical protein QUF61_11800 [Candidatus Venteria ishoeyi]|uniref:hypothetical protein n=1 Tax=Candidatus Venteria ishoeyi TaxID=1899563 RepID=UPI0025A65E32|nr:hypothetical protein [Candidatus Venteria ishoeyi]MDM8547169.1 hypothetical protein [Candidatus Venteria ishoeyi]
MLKNIALLIIILITLNGCNQSYIRKTNLDYAHDALQRGDAEAAYRLAEDYLDDGNEAAKKARSVINNPQIIRTALSTFSKSSLKNSTDKYGQVQAAKLEKDRLALFETIADSIQINTARENFEFTFPGYLSNSAQQAIVFAEKEKAKKKLAATEKKHKVEAEEKRIENIQIHWLDARNKAHAICRSEAQCRKMFALTQIFISQKAAMKIQLATNTIIETYKPSSSYDVGAKAIKTPMKRNSEEIRLHLFCSPVQSELCYKQEREIYIAFPKFISDKT